MNHLPSREQPCKEDQSSSSSSSSSNTLEDKLQELYQETAAALSLKRREINDIDEKIAQVCSEIMQVKQRRQQDALEFQQEMEHYSTKLTSLQQIVQQKLLSLQRRNKQTSNTTTTNGGSSSTTTTTKEDLSVYKDTVSQVFTQEEPIIQLPTFALAKQSQLCQHVHYITVTDNQYHIATIQTSAMAQYLERVLRQETDALAVAELNLLNECMKRDTSTREFQKAMQTYTAQQEELIQRIQKQIRKEAEQQEQRQQQEEEEHEEEEEEEVEAGDAEALPEESSKQDDKASNKEIHTNNRDRTKSTDTVETVSMNSSINSSNDDSLDGHAISKTLEQCRTSKPGEEHHQAVSDNYQNDGMSRQ